MIVNGITIPTSVRILRSESQHGPNRMGVNVLRANSLSINAEINLFDEKMRRRLSLKLKPAKGRQSCLCSDILFLLVFSP